VQWLHGWQKHEAREALAAQTAELADAALQDEPELDFSEPELEFDDELDEFDFDEELEFDEEAEPVPSGS
jgi:hypothetical protein